MCLNKSPDSPLPRRLIIPKYKYHIQANTLLLKTIHYL